MSLQAFRRSHIYHTKPVHLRDIPDGCRPQRHHKQTLQCIIAVEVMFVPSSYDINPSPLLYYRQTAMEHNNRNSEESDDSDTDNQNAPLLGNR
jgi:hypothetical protein